jgi:hypothetical protein
MGQRQLVFAIVLAAGLLCTAGPAAQAAETGFSTYGLGGAAFGAGVTPPPGTYVTTAVGYYTGNIEGNVTFGNAVIDVALKVKFLSVALNGLYVPERKVLGGNLGLGLTVPVGFVDFDARATLGPLAGQRSTDGPGLGDIVPRAQVGWQHGDLAHTLYVQGVLPTGRYEPSFSPNIGLHRPGIDTGWAFTWTDKTHKLQFNGAVGVTFNFENTDTNYKTGDELHFEWAIGREFSPGLVLGIVGYDYRQLTGDSGSGATLGPFKGNVDAVGLGFSYTTLVGATPWIINARHYQEYAAERRFEGSMSIFSVTTRF